MDLLSPPGKRRALLPKQVVAGSVGMESLMKILVLCVYQMWLVLCKGHPAPCLLPCCLGSSADMWGKVKRPEV